MSTGSTSPATIQDAFVAVVGDGITVSADRKKLDDDTSRELSDHEGLNAAVVANGPTLVTYTDGTLFALIPHPSGTIDNILLKPGNTPLAAPTTTMTTAPANPPA